MKDHHLLTIDICELLFDLNLKLRDSLIQLIHFDFISIINNVNEKIDYLKKLPIFVVIIFKILKFDHLM